MANPSPIGVDPTGDPEYELRRRVGRTWREIRRGASATRLRALFYGDDGDDDALDLALADALAVLCLQGPMRMGELADALHITPASTTRAVTCLTEKGYATRVKAADDQRSIQVSATEAGLARYQAIAARVHLALSEILGAFTDNERHQFAELLERFAASVDTYVSSHDQQR